MVNQWRIYICCKYVIYELIYSSKLAKSLVTFISVIITGSNLTYKYTEILFFSLKPPPPPKKPPKTDLNSRESPEMKITDNSLLNNRDVERICDTAAESLWARSQRMCDGPETQLPEVRRSTEGRSLCICVCQQPVPWYVDPLSAFIRNTRQLHRAKEPRTEIKEVKGSIRCRDTVHIDYKSWTARRSSTPHINISIFWQR